MDVKLFDSHGHYTDERLLDDALIKEIFDSGVGRILVPASDLPDSKEAIALAEKYDGMYAAVGIHPHEVESAPSPAEAKDEILNGNVTVNGEKELRRGKKLKDGDVVSFAGKSIKIIK